MQRGHAADVWVSGDGEGKVRVWVLKGTPSATVLVGHRYAVNSIAVSGTRIFSGTWDKTIRVWDISTLTHTQHPGWAYWFGDRHRPDSGRAAPGVVLFRQVTQGVVYSLPQLPAYCATGCLSLFTCCVAAR